MLKQRLEQGHSANSDKSTAEYNKFWVTVHPILG